MDRVHLQYLLEKGMRKSEIAKLLGFDVSTIYRELKRNIHTFYKNTTINNKHYAYHHSFAQSKANNRRYVKPRKLDIDKSLRDYVLKKLKEYWSPKQIEGRLKLESTLENIVTHETIYQYIYKKWQIRYRFSKYLRRKRINRIPVNSRRKRHIPESMLIRNRPAEISTRESFGHWECDLMIFNKNTKCNLITLRERKTRFVIVIKNNNKLAYDTASNIIRKLKQFSKYVKSITFDQGSEFFRYNWLKKTLGTEIYFCNPASPYQKGEIENVNGIIRVHFPRNIDIGLVSQNRIDALARNINNRPMECHNYSTAMEVFNKAIGYKITN